MKVRISMLALIAALCACAPMGQRPDAGAAHDASAYVVNSYPKDTKAYRYIELDNGIRAMLVSDPSATTSSASMSVAVGSWQDPPQWQGLAHFLEHMLFLGTEKYPDPDAYDKYLKGHAGKHNAYTSTEKTNYHFSIESSAFEGALDRFAQFFIAPLFTEEYVDREKNAVHSEYFTRINNDVIRGGEIIENVINPEHPAYKFNGGNLKTLADKPGETARDALISFYNKYYSADIMTLAVASDKSLDELEKMVRGNFSAVPRVDRPEAIEFPPLFTEGELPRVVEIKPLSEGSVLSLMWILPVIEGDSETDSRAFLANLFNYEGDNSLSNRLIEKGWIEGLAAGPGVNFGGNDTFAVQMGMTGEGVQHQDEVIAAVFDMIRLAREQGVEEWRYNDIKKMTNMSFHFRGDSSFGLQEVISTANALAYTLPKDLITPGFQKYDEKLIRSILDGLTPGNLLVTLVAQDVKPDRKTEFYGANYRTYQPSAEQLESWSTPQFTDLEFDKPNPLLPENLELVDVVTPDKPVKLENTGEIELWHYPYTEGGTPTANIMLALDRSKKRDIEQYITESMYFNLYEEQMRDLAHNVSRAGMRCAFSPTSIKYGGYSDKLPELADLTLSDLQRPRYTQQQFDRLKESMMRKLRNIDQMEPHKLVARNLRQLLNVNSYSKEELTATVEGMTLEKVLDYKNRLYRDVKMQMLVSGNITAEQARDFALKIQDQLKITSSDTKARGEMSIVKLPPKEQRDVFLVDSTHQDAVVLRYYQGRDNSREEVLRMGFLGKLIGQEYYNSLRTEQQLGYIVSAGSSTIGSVPGLRMLVESPTADANAIEAANDQFVRDFKNVLDGMSDDDLAPFKEMIIQQVEREAQTPGERVARFWSELRLGRDNIRSNDEVIADVEAVSMKDVQEMYEQAILEDPRALSVIAPGAKDGVEATVEDRETFQASHETYDRG